MWCFERGVLGSKAKAIARSLRPVSYFGGGEGIGSVDARRIEDGSGSRMEEGEEEEDDDDDEIPLYMWERNGETVMRIPWFECQCRREWV